MLEPGHVLFVPKHWWHFVESLNTSISVNMWVNVESDCLDRVQEAIARNVVMSMRTPNEAARPEDWMVSPDVSSPLVKLISLLLFYINYVLNIKNIHLLVWLSLLYSFVCLSIINHFSVYQLVCLVVCLVKSSNHDTKMTQSPIELQWFGCKTFYRVYVVALETDI